MPGDLVSSAAAARSLPAGSFTNFLEKDMQMPATQRQSRRQFLQGIAAAGAAGVLLPSARAFGFQSPSERPVFATIGLRNQGWAITSKSFGFADFAALADVDSNVLGENVERVEKAQGKKPDAYKDYRKILDRKDIDAVMIATPDHWHTKIAVEAMKAGKDVYCEKPLTLTIDEGKLIEKVVTANRPGFSGRYNATHRDRPAFPEGNRSDQSRPHRHGEEGDVRHRPHGGLASDSDGGCSRTDRLGLLARPGAQGSLSGLPEMRQGYGGGVPLYSNCHYSFRNWHEYSGGKLTDWGAHHVDIACWALGATNTGPSKITPVEYQLAVEYKDGIRWSTIGTTWRPSSPSASPCRTTWR